METIKIENIETTTVDIGTMYWQEACDCCEALGNGWHLPTKEELNFLYQNKDVIGGFSNDYYWSSTEVNETVAWTQEFGGGYQEYDDKVHAPSAYYVRPVRNV